MSVVCFDKTGTLTNSWIDIVGFWTAEKQMVAISDVADHEKRGLIYQLMGSCHQVSVYNNQYYGDPIDVKMLAFSGYAVDKQENGNQHSSTVSNKLQDQIQILKVFEFHSEY